MSDIYALRKELRELGEKLSHPIENFPSPKELGETAKRYAELEKRIEILEKIDVAERRIKELDALLAEEKDPEFLPLAEAERQEISAKKKELEHALAGDGKERGGEKEHRALILELRAGVGGEEAALFAQTLARMYERFCEKNSWKCRLLDASRTELGGAKELIYEISGRGAYTALRFESGVHRVQRIPETEKGGRVHTSTISVAVLPEAQQVDVQIRPDEVRVDVYRSSGPGGQHANKTSSAVRITHLPTGLVVQSQTARSQIENREIAMTILRSRILQKKQEEEQGARASERSRQIGTADRSEKVRTYNFPQDRITDHRVGKSWHNIGRILDGDLSEIIESLQSLT